MEKRTGCTHYPVGMATIQEKEITKAEYEETTDSTRVESQVTSCYY